MSAREERALMESGRTAAERSERERKAYEARLAADRLLHHLEEARKHARVLVARRGYMSGADWMGLLKTLRGELDSVWTKMTRLQAPEPVHQVHDVHDVHDGTAAHESTRICTNERRA